MWFNYTTTGSPSSNVLYKVPGENWDFTDTSLNSQSASVRALIAKLDKASQGDKTIVSSANGDNYRARADITAYANECKLLGQTYMYLGVCDASTRNSFATQGWSENQEDVAALSFVTGPFTGLLTVKTNLVWTDVSAVSVAGTSYTNPCPNQAAIHRTKGNYVLYRLPLPKLTETQEIVDYKLKISIHGNILSSGYTLEFQKVPDGADYFANQWTAGEHPFEGAVIEDARAYNNNATMNYKASTADYEPAVAHLTSYAKELTEGDTVPEYMYVTLRATASSTCTLKGDGQASSLYPAIEYTIFDSKGIAEAFDVTELKIVPNSSDRYDTADVDTLTAGTSYRAVMKATSIDMPEKATTMYIAIYNDNELESLSVSPVTIDRASSDYFVWSDAFSVADAGKKVKVFLWNGSSVSPLIANQEATVVAAAAEE